MDLRSNQRINAIRTSALTNVGKSATQVDKEQEYHVSEHKDVQGATLDKVAGTGDVEHSALDQYQEIFEGVELEFLKDKKISTFR